MPTQPAASHGSAQVVKALDVVGLPGLSTAYTGNYASLPTPMLKPPPEGNRSIPVGINWLRDGQAPGFAVEFNARSQRTVPITQISAVYIDNSINLSNIVLWWPDTNFAVTAPANSSGYYPVLSNGLQFFAFCEVTPGTSDRTFLQVLNFLPPALALSSGPAQGASLGTVTNIATVSPVIGGPITTQGTISLDSNALQQMIEGYTDLHLSGTFEVAGQTTLAATEIIGALDVDGALIVGEPPGETAVTTPGTIAAQGPILINHNAAAPPAPVWPFPLTMIQLNGADGLHEPAVEMNGFTGSPALVFRRAGGTGQNPTGTLPGQNLFTISGRGYGVTDWTQQPNLLQISTVEQFTDTAQGTQFAINLTPAGTIVPGQAMLLDGSGNLTIYGPGPNNAVKPGGGAWSAPSDRRLKRDVAPYDGGLPEIVALEPITYAYNGVGGLAAGGRYVGLDAARAQAVLPGLVGQMTYTPTALDAAGDRIATGPEEKYATLDPSELVYALINAVRTLDRRLEQLELELKGQAGLGRDAAARPQHRRGSSH